MSRAPWSSNYNVQSKEMNCCKPIAQRAFRHPPVNPEFRREVEAAGIAPASQIPQVVSQHGTYVEQGCQWLHYVCTEEALQEHVAAWHGLALEVRDAIVRISRGQGDFSRVGE